MVARVHNTKHDLTTAIPASRVMLAALLAIVVGASVRVAAEEGSFAGGSAVQPAPVAQSCCARSGARGPVSGLVVAVGQHGRGIEGTYDVASR